MKKKVFCKSAAIVLAVVLFFTLLPGAAMAEEIRSEQTGGDITSVAGTPAELCTDDFEAEENADDETGGQDDCYQPADADGDLSYDSAEMTEMNQDVEEKTEVNQDVEEKTEIADPDEDLISLNDYSSYYDDDYDDDWYLSDSSIIIPAGTQTAYLYADYCYVSSVKSSNNSIVNAEIYSRGSNYCTILLTKKVSGTATITVTASDGTTKTCKVTCKISAMTLNTKSISFGKKNAYSTYYIRKKDYNDQDWTIKSASSSKKKIASVKKDAYGNVVVTAKKAGKTTVTITDSFGRKAKVKVVVAKSWKKANLKQLSYDYLGRSSKKMRVYSKPGTTVKVTIGGRTFVKKIGKQGSAEVNVKKKYKYQTPYKVVYNYKGTKVTRKGKVYSGTSASWGRIYSCEYTIPVKVYNVEKGDIITLKVGGEKYTKKATYSAEKAEYVFNTRYANRNYSMLEIQIKDKYKKTVYNNSWNIYW